MAIRELKTVLGAAFVAAALFAGCSAGEGGAAGSDAADAASDAGPVEDSGIGVLEDAGGGDIGGGDVGGGDVGGDDAGPGDVGGGPDDALQDAAEDVGAADVAVDAGADAADAGDAQGDAEGDAEADAGPPPGDGPGWWLGGDCDPLVPTVCAMPFPSDVWSIEDPTTATGRRVMLGDTTAQLAGGLLVADPTYLSLSDGFSPGATLLAHLPGATVDGLAPPEHPEDSLDPASLTVILEVATGRRIAHFSELDTWPDTDDGRTFMLRPVERLKDGTRYIVAIRGVLGTDGVPLAPSPTFEALRDGLASDDVSVERRAAWYEEIFSTLEAEGVPREDLQLAWDFTTASRENNTAAMLAMRDDSLAALGDGGSPYTIDTVEDDWSPHVARLVRGHITVPLYLDKPGPGGKMTVDADGMPMLNGTAEYPFVIMIPNSAKDEPKALMQFGHGLFGSRDAALDGDMQALADAYGFTVFATDWLGMSKEDPPAIAVAIGGGDVLEFRTVPDRSRQGFLNMLLLMRTMRTTMVSDPAVQVGGHPAWKTDEVYYLGGSQGGIYGATYMALTQEIERGVLAVPGQTYSLMLPRSIHFDPFWAVISAVYKPLDAQLLLGFAQMVWDRAEPTGYADAIVTNPLPGTPPHQVLLLEAIGDHQVPNLSSELLARAIGIPHLQPGNNTLWGIDPVASPIEGSAFVDMDYGLPPVPSINQPMREGKDPHSAAFGNASVIIMAEQFLRTGIITMTCNGPCDPE